MEAINSTAGSLLLDLESFEGVPMLPFAKCRLENLTVGDTLH